MRLLKKYYKFKYPLIIIYLLIFYNPYLFISALEIENNLLENSSISIIDNNIEDKYINNENSNFYILGPGDKILVKFYGLDFLDSEYIINAEGEIFLPELKNFKVQGKTIPELKLELKTKYEKYIFDPQLDILITKYRPITFYLNGEVRNPGLYNLAYEKKMIPRLFHALQEGKGFTNNADLSKVEVIRANPESNGGGKIKAEINLISLFEKGEQSLNIRIFDGDTIIVPKTNIPMKEQILKVNRTNISPEEITVFITGNSIFQGPTVVKRGSSLIQAIASSGGKKLYTGKIEFIRFNYDGSTSKSYFRYNPNAKINSKNNPILMDGDLIHVKRTLIGTASQYLKEVSSPVLSLYGFYKLIN
jgi:polysaccharide export outer membrane protein